MIWLTWRQHRLQAAIGATILALLVAGLLATKGQLDAYARDVAACATALSCAEARDGLAHFVDSYIPRLDLHPAGRGLRDAGASI